jgi:hypothetical protein
MIEAVGSMATSIGRAVSAPAVGGEMGRIGSVAAPKAIASGSSFSPKLGMSGILAETRPFVPSAISVPEMPIGKSADVFSSAWSTIGKTKAPTVATMPKVDSLQKLGFEPFVAKPITIAEKSISLDKGEWKILAQSTPQSIAEKLFPEAKPFLPKDPVFEKTVTNKDLTILVESAYKTTPTEEEVIVKSLEAEKKQSQKVVDLLTEVGLYTKDEAAKRVAKIVEKKNVAQTETENKAEAQAKVEAQPLPEPWEQGSKRITRQTQVKTDSEDEETEKKLLKEKPLKEVPVVDDKAQTSRKKEVKEKISGLFNKARWFGPEKVNSKEIVDGLEKNRQNRSLLLSQLMYPLLPDGSLDEVVKSVDSMGELVNISKISEQEVAEQVETVLDRNVPVKLTKENAKQVSEKDVKKVLKYLQQESVVG